MVRETVVTPYRLIVSLGIAAAVVGAVLVGVLTPGSADAATGTTPAAVSLTAPASGTYGAKIALTGDLWKYQTTTKIANADVVLQRATHGQTNWSNLGTAKTSATGTFSFSVTQQAPYDYRAYYAGSTVYKAALSAVKYPVVNQSVSIDSQVTADQTTGALTATGKVLPAPPNGTKVYFEWLALGGQTWTTFATGTTTSGTVNVTGIRAGSIANYRLRVDARAGLGAAVSTAKTYTHYVWRGAFGRGFGSNTGGFANAINDPAGSSGVLVHDYIGDEWSPFTGCAKASWTVARIDQGDGVVTASLTDRGGDRVFTKFDLSAAAGYRHTWEGELPAMDNLRQEYAANGIVTNQVQMILKVLCAN